MNSQFRWLIDRELKESLDQPEQARVYAATMANRSDYPSLSEAGVMYLALREPVLAESCFWFIDGEVQEKGAKVLNDVVRIRYGTWLYSKRKPDPESVKVLSIPVTDKKFEHYRLQHLGKAHLALKDTKKALECLLKALDLRMAIEAPANDLAKADLLRSTRYAIGFCLRADKKSFAVRDASREDLKKLTELAMRSKGYWPHPKEYVEACRPYFTLKAEDLKLQKLRVAELADGTILGFSGFLLEKNYLEHLFIEPKFIDCGIGLALWDDLLKFCKKSKIASFEMMADPFAEKFYQGRGCKSVKKIPSRIQNGPDHVLMSYSAG